MTPAVRRLTTSVVLNGQNKHRSTTSVVAVWSWPATIGVDHDGNGVSQQYSREVSVVPARPEYLRPQATPALEDKDLVIAAAGQRLETDSDLTAIMAQNPKGRCIRRSGVARQRKRAGGVPPAIDVSLAWRAKSA
jgi:hypothetical protein